MNSLFATLEIYLGNQESVNSVGGVFFQLKMIGLNPTNDFVIVSQYFVWDYNCDKAVVRCPLAKQSCQQYLNLISDPLATNANMLWGSGFFPEPVGALQCIGAFLRIFS